MRATLCRHGGQWGHDLDGGQGEAVRVPQAQGTLVKLPAAEDSALLPSLLTLSDVFCTGHHAAVKARVGPRTTVTAIGDGARAVLECVGTRQAIEMAFAVARDGGLVSRVGAPQYEDGPVGFDMLMRNITLTGGVAPARAYIEQLLPDVLDGIIEPGRVFDVTVGLERVPDGYRAMADRQALKVLVAARLAQGALAVLSFVVFLAARGRGAHPMAPLELFRSWPVIALTSLVAGRAAARVGPRLPTVVGQAIMAAGLLVLCLAATVRAPTLVLAVLMVPVGLGGAVAIPAVTASGVLNTSRQVGGALAIAGHAGVGTTAEDVVRVAEHGVVEQRGRDREDEGSDEPQPRDGRGPSRRTQRRPSLVAGTETPSWSGPSRDTTKAGDVAVGRTISTSSSRMPN